MKKSFNTFEYVKDLGADLIREFEKKGKTTHPHSIGEGREKSAIDKLRDILPDGVDIGSGFVIDSFGNTSSQCDIIIYEKNLCLKFNNDDEKYRYYNCESVIAVGEVKSDLGTREFIDSMKKFKKIKNLKRRIEGTKFRGYLSANDLIGTESETIDQLNNEFDQIFTFLICNSLNIKIETIISEIDKLGYQRYEYFNCIISVDGKYIGYAKQVKSQLHNKISAIESDFVTFCNNDYAFGMLLDMILLVVRNGRSVSYNPNIYISKSNYDVSLYKL